MYSDAEDQSVGVGIASPATLDNVAPNCSTSEDACMTSSGATSPTEITASTRIVDKASSGHLALVYDTTDAALGLTPVVSASAAATWSDDTFVPIGNSYAILILRSTDSTSTAFADTLLVDAIDLM